MRHTRTRLIAIGAALTLALAGAACSSDEDTTATGDDPTTTEANAPMEDTDTTMSDDMMGDDMMAPSGPACSAVPADGAGSFAGMAQDPAATAASNNPLLSTLVTAVGEAGLVDTLNGPGPFTIFAPVNDAFAAIPEEDLNAVLADEALLTDVLTYHVVAGQSSSDELVDAGTVETVQGGTLEIVAAGDSFTVNGAEVLCQNVMTANATVFLIDTVLMPG